MSQINILHQHTETVESDTNAIGWDNILKWIIMLSEGRLHFFNLKKSKEAFSRMHTSRFSDSRGVSLQRPSLDRASLDRDPPYTETSCTETPLDRDPPGQRPPLGRNPPVETLPPQGTWFQRIPPHRRNIGPGSQTGSGIILRPPRGQTPVKTLSCPQLRLRAVNILQKYNIILKLAKWLIKFNLGTIQNVVQDTSSQRIVAWNGHCP